MLMTSRKKVVGESSGKTIVQKRRHGRAPSIAAASISDFGIALQAGEEEQEVVRDLLPDRGHDDQQHRLVAVEQVVPVDAALAQRVRDDADARREHEEPQHAGDRGRDGVGPDQQRLVDERALDDAVGEDREQQRDARCRARRPAIEKIAVVLNDAR